jgi:hypothetical protein
MRLAGNRRSELMGGAIRFEFWGTRIFNNIERTAGTVRAMEDSGKQGYRITNGSRLNDRLRSAHEGDWNIKR